LASKGKLHGKKNGMRETKFQEISLTYPWNILGTGSLPMVMCDRNNIHTTTIGYQLRFYENFYKQGLRPWTR
jgi:hypothetical protein